MWSCDDQTHGPVNFHSNPSVILSICLSVCLFCNGHLVLATRAMNPRVPKTRYKSD